MSNEREYLDKGSWHLIFMVLDSLVFTKNCMPKLGWGEGEGDAQFQTQTEKVTEEENKTQDDR